MARTIRHSTNAWSDPFGCVGRIIGTVHMRSRDPPLCPVTQIGFN